MEKEGKRKKESKGTEKMAFLEKTSSLTGLEGT